MTPELVLSTSGPMCQVGLGPAGTIVVVSVLRTILNPRGGELRSLMIRVGERKEYGGGRADG